MDLLVLAAAPQELGDVPGEVVGVGPVIAAAAAARILAARRPRAVALVGTAGAYPGGPAVGEAIAAHRLGLSGGIAVLGLGYVPRPPAPLYSDPALLDRLDAPRHDVLTVGAITTDPALVRRLGGGYTVEHMETYGVAVAAQQLGIPFVAVLGITNDVGPDAHAQWLANREDAQRAALAVLAGLLPGAA